MNRIGWVIVSLAVCLIVGCHSGKKAPEGYPELVPVTIHVTHHGEPFGEASVQLGSAQTVHLSIVGRTDDKGTALPETAMGSYVASGIPKGTFKLSISKYDLSGVTPTASATKPGDPNAPSEMTAEASMAAAMSLSSAPLIVPKALADLESTPIEITVDGSVQEFTYEISDYE